MISDTEAQAAADRAEEDMARLIEDAKKWRHAMQGEQKCGNCRFRDTISSGHQQIQSVCRRHPPGVVENGNAIWPAVSGFDWCGEWQPAQQKKGFTDSPIEDLGLSVRTRNLLLRGGVATAKDLVEFNWAAIRNLRGMGDISRKEIWELREKLKQSQGGDVDGGDSALDERIEKP